MKKSVVKKAIPFFLPLAIWLGITIIMALAVYVIPSFTPTLDGSEWAVGVGAAVINGLVQIAVVCVLTVIAVKEFGFGMKKFAVSLPIMYVLFSVYHVPSLYIFAYTAEWSFMFTTHDAMNRFLAAFLITLQYGIVMLFTLTAVCKDRKSDIVGK